MHRHGPVIVQCTDSVLFPKKPCTGPIYSEMANRYDVKYKSLVPYVLNTNSAHQAEFTKCK